MGQTGRRKVTHHGMHLRYESKDTEPFKMIMKNQYPVFLVVLNTAISFIFAMFAKALHLMRISYLKRRFNMRFHFLYFFLAFIVTFSSCSPNYTNSRKWEVIYSKDYTDQVQIGQGSPVICPIQLQDDKFLFCLNNNLYIKHLQDDITAIASDIFTDFTVDTAVPTSWQGQWIIQNDEMCYFTTIHQADEEFSFNLCCKNPSDHRSKWETMLFSEKNFSLNHRTN